MLKKDFKKHLLRAKQYAEQNFGRTEKSEVLTEDLEALIQRINYMKTACHNTNKKIQAVLKDHGGQDKDKRMKKIPEYQVAVQMMEAGQTLGQESLMGQLYTLCGDAELQMSSHLVDCEMEVESRVLAPLHNLAEQEIPNILKKKKQLKDLVGDMDSARARYYSATDKYHQQPGGAAKIDSAKEEMEDSQTKVEQCRDQLSTEMFAFSAKEADNSKFLVELIKIQTEYHEKALKALKEAIPRLDEVCEQNNQVPVYGTHLEEHLRRTNREIATVIEICIAILAEDGLREEGLFRIAGAASKLKKVKAAFDAGLVPDMNEIRDVHCMAGALKLYLRELPEPLLTYELYNEWMQAAHLPHEERMQTLWLLCDKLPKNNHDNLRYLVKFLAKLSEYHETNKMTPSNIAIVIGPNLLWQQDVGQSVLTTSSQSAILESFISHSEYFFPGAFEPVTTETISATATASLPQMRKQQTSLPNMSNTKSLKRSKHKTSIDIGIGSAHNTLTAPLSKPKTKPHIQVIHNTDISAPILNTQMFNANNKKEDADDRQSIDSGIESSGPSSTRPSLHGKPSMTGDLTKHGTILESDVKIINNNNIISSISKTEKSSPLLKETESDPGMLNLVTEQSCKRAITPPPKPPPPRSVHSDMYDTLFALQSLQDGTTDGNAVNDYLTTVRTLWDGQYMSKGNKRFSVGPTESAFLPEGAIEVVGGEDASLLGRDRARASSESRILEATRSQQKLNPINENTVAQNTSLTTSVTCDDVFAVVSMSNNSDLVATVDNKTPHQQQPVVPKRKKKSPVKEIDFGTTNNSDKNPPDEDPFLMKEPTPNNPSLSASSSGSNLYVEAPVPEASPRSNRKEKKKPAPLPPTVERPAPPPPIGQSKTLERKHGGPGSTSSLELNQPGTTGSLERKVQPPERPPPAEKPHFVSQVSDKAEKPVDRPPIPERPSLGPPPAPPKQQQQPPDNQGSSNNKQQEQSISPGPLSVSPGVSGKPERPRLPSDRPLMPPPEKPTSPAYDLSVGNKTNGSNSNSLPYSAKPEKPAKSDNIASIYPKLPQPDSPTLIKASNNNTTTTSAPVSPNPGKSVTSKPPRPCNPPPPHPKPGSQGSEKDFQFIKEDQQGLAVPLRSTSQESGDKVEVPRTPDACETHL